MKCVKLTLVDGTKHELQMDGMATIEALIAQVSKEFGVDPSHVRLILRGAVLCDHTHPIASLQLNSSDIFICNVLCPQRDLSERSSDFQGKVARLVEMGFTANDSATALRAKGGNIDAAAAMLMETASASES
jgi:hypothetical protein